MTRETTAIILILGGLFLFLYSCLRTSSRQSRIEEEQNDPVKTAINRKVRVLKSYFFDDNNKLDFRKFCDYVLCIREDEHESRYIEHLAELEMLVASCDNLGPSLLNLLFEERSIIAIVGSESEFKFLQGYIRDGKFKGTYGDFAYILFTTVFYLKNKLRNNEQK